MTSAFTQCPRSRLSRLAGLVVFVVLLLALVSCSSTLTPAPVPPAQTIAYDGNAQNAGIISIDADGAVITPAKRAYYNSLIEIYGAAKWTKAGLPVFPSPLVRDDGITEAGDNYRITRGALANLTVMHQWFKMGRTPQ